MAEPFIGQITLFPYSFAPRNWAWCEGGILPISQYQALYAIVGTTYGGNGTTSLGLPDLRDRAPVQYGQTPGFDFYPWGVRRGTNTVTLTEAQMPPHTHSVVASDDNAGENAPQGKRLAAAGQPGRGGQFSPVNMYAPDGSNRVSMASQALGQAGGGQPHYNVQPYLAVHFCIALEGLFPPRS